jgi:hypothetical protein
MNCDHMAYLAKQDRKQRLENAVADGAQAAQHHHDPILNTV